MIEAMAALVEARGTRIAIPRGRRTKVMIEAMTALAEASGTRIAIPRGRLENAAKVELLLRLMWW